MDQAEALRNVVKLKKQENKPNARVITITSGKGGVGKSNVAVNLAVWMKKCGKRVIIFDADFGLANVEVMFGAAPRYNLSDVLYHGKRIADVITEGPMGIGFISAGSGIVGLNNLSPDQMEAMVRSFAELDGLADIIDVITEGPMGIGFISAGSGIVGLNNLSPDQMEAMVRSFAELDGLADIILIDTGAGISDQVLRMILASREVLLVTTPDPSSLTDSYSLLKALYTNPAFERKGTKISVLANRVLSEEEGRSVYEKLNSVVFQFLQGSVFYAGMIPQDTALEKAVRQQQPVSLYLPFSRSAKAFERAALGLLNGAWKQEEREGGISRMFSGFWKHRQL